MQQCYPCLACDYHFTCCVCCRSLLADVGARLWRVRQAACASLTDLLAGRRWPQLAPHMEQVGARSGCYLVFLTAALADVANTPLFMLAPVPTLATCRSHCFASCSPGTAIAYVGTNAAADVLMSAVCACSLLIRCCRHRQSPLPPRQLWVMGLRAADDVKESVRGAAGGLVRSLRGLSLRLMDAAQSPAAGARQAGGAVCAGSCCGLMTVCSAFDALDTTQPRRQQRQATWSSNDDALLAMRSGQLRSGCVHNKPA